jgi:hypothetical protein
VDRLAGSGLADVLDGLLVEGRGGEDDRPRDDIAVLGLRFQPRAATQQDERLMAAEGG